MIQLRNVTLDLGARRIFEDISCVFQSEDHVGIIGRNGAGKSTLLKVIAGFIKPTEGQVSITKGARIGYLPQEEILASTMNVFDEAFSAFDIVVKTENRLQEIDVAIADGSVTAEMLEEYAELHATSAGLDKHVAIKNTNDVLAGLGFSQDMIKKNVNELSTGWKMRLALAKLLLTDADFYLFDEPTNHLDIVTQQWFLERLQAMPQGFLLVSHDRAYLEKACTNILEIERGRGTYYRGNLQAYLTLKEANQEIARNTRARQERDIEKKQATAERFRSGTRAKQAQSLFKQIERIELVEVEPMLPTLNFHFPTPERPGAIILTVENVACDFNGMPVFKSVSFEIERGERVALVAANGVGKTTLINCIIGKYKLAAGTVKFGYGVKTAYFEQDQARALPPEKTIFEEVREACPRVTDAEIRKVLGAFQYSGNDVFKKIKVLSGGEKNRVAMTKVLLQRANFLILDEPTNHLDLYAEDVLRQALSGYEGTMLFVSHNLNFISQLATHILELTPTGVNSFPGTYEEFCHAKKLKQESIQTGVTPKTHNNSAVEQQKKEQLTRELRKQVTELERTIVRLEGDQIKRSDLLTKYTYGTHEYAQALKRLQGIQKELADTQSEWEKLTEQLK